MTFFVRLAASAAAASLAIGAGAQTLQPAVIAPAPALVASEPVIAAVPMVLRSGSAVRLSTEEPLSSKTSKVGDRFRLKVAEDVRIGNQLVIPAGSPAIGEVTVVTKKGAFGKSGKLETRILHAKVGDHTIALSGKSNQAGAGGTGATVAAAVLVGVFSAFVTGKSAEFPVGTGMTGFVESDLPVLAVAAPQTAPLAVPVATPAPPAPITPTPVSAPIATTSTPTT